MKDLAEVNSAVIPIDAASLIAKAVESNVPVETMERLLAMRKELRAEQAKEDYDRAMSKLQGVMPVIKKNKSVMNKDGKTVRYKYAPLDDIIEQAGPVIREHGFSYKSNTVFQDGFIVATIKVTHDSGHSEETSFPVPIDKDAYMNNQQQHKSADTFAKRVAFCNAFGIVTADEDDDANSAGKAPSAKEIFARMARHAEAVRQNWDSINVIRESLAVNDYPIAVEAYYELSDEAKNDLQLAPTKGGIFTTKEREQMKSDLWGEAREMYFGSKTQEEL